jgi:dTDP-4-dehydrorhamnose reductase
LKVAVTGASGQLGGAVLEAVTREGHTAVSLTRAELNLEEEAVEATIAELEVDWIVHCAAYTAVDLAEARPQYAQRINASASAAVARGAARSGARLLYVSTDYVFDGAAQAPYREDSKTNPINVYGLSKRDGEEAVARILERALIVRTSWLMGGTTPNFASTMMRLGREKDELSVVADQVGRPTWVFDLAPALVKLMTQDAQGVFHVANDGQATWYEVAKRLFAQASAQGEDLGGLKLRETTTERYGAPAARPLYSVLDLNRARELHGVTLPDWRLGLARALESCP